MLLADALKLLASDHPLRVALSPMVETNQTKLAASAATSYNHLRGCKTLSPTQRETLADVFYSLILDRFKTYNRQQIHTMLDLPDIRKTVAGREVYEEGQNDGQNDGQTIGQTNILLRQARRKFGALPSAIEARISTLSDARAGELAECILDFDKLAQLQAWLGRAEPVVKEPIAAPTKRPRLPKATMKVKAVRRRAQLV